MPTVLKKLALMIGTNPKSAKILVGIIIGLIVIVFMPVALILHIFSSDNLQIDSSTLIQTVESQLSQEELAAIEQVNTIGMAIQSQMAEQGLDADQIREAQVLYVLALSNYSTADDFVEKLSGCFEAGQTDQQLISAVNSAFGTAISSADFSTIMTRVRSTYISISNYEIPEEKNNLDLVHYAINAKESGWGYVWGTYGQVLTRSAYESQLSMYPTEVGRYADFITSNWIGRRTTDCVGLIKGYGWLNAETSEIVYGTNGMPDITADDMYNAATVKGPISTIPEIPGLAVWHVGHIGIYIGNGQVIQEALKIWDTATSRSDTPAVSDEMDFVFPAPSARGGSSFPYDSEHNSVDSDPDLQIHVARSIVHLSSGLAKMIQGNIQAHENDTLAVDRKLWAKIQEKKQAQGLKY